MTPQQWAEVKERFHEALEEPEERRKDFLARRCSSDVVRMEAERLIAEHSRSSEFLTWPALKSVARAGTALGETFQAIRGSCCKNGWARAPSALSTRF